jgi:hypothetical protein
VRFTYGHHEFEFPSGVTQADKGSIAKYPTEEGCKNPDYDWWCNDPIVRPSSAVDEEADAIVEAYFWASMRQRASRFALFGLLPPILILIAGSALLWAVAGFRPKTT